MSTKTRTLFEERVVIREAGFGNDEECRCQVRRYPMDDHGYSVAVVHMVHGTNNGYGYLNDQSVERQVRDTDINVSDSSLIRDAIEAFDDFVSKFRV